MRKTSFLYIIKDVSIILHAEDEFIFSFLNIHVWVYNTLLEEICKVWIHWILWKIASHPSQENAQTDGWFLLQFHNGSCLCLLLVSGCNLLRRPWLSKQYHATTPVQQQLRSYQLQQTRWPLLLQRPQEEEEEEHCSEEGWFRSCTCISYELNREHIP